MSVKPADLNRPGTEFSFCSEAEDDFEKIIVGDNQPERSQTLIPLTDQAASAEDLIAASRQIAAATEFSANSMPPAPPSTSFEPHQAEAPATPQGAPLETLSSHGDSSLLRAPNKFSLKSFLLNCITCCYKSKENAKSK